MFENTPHHTYTYIGLLLTKPWQTFSVRIRLLGFLIDLDSLMKMNIMKFQFQFTAPYWILWKAETNEEQEIEGVGCLGQLLTFLVATSANSLVVYSPSHAFICLPPLCPSPYPFRTQWNINKFHYQRKHTRVHNKTSMATSVEDCQHSEHKKLSTFLRRRSHRATTHPSLCPPLCLSRSHCSSNNHLKTPSISSPEFDFDVHWKHFSFASQTIFNCKVIAEWRESQLSPYFSTIQFLKYTYI